MEPRQLFLQRLARGKYKLASVSKKIVSYFNTEPKNTFYLYVTVASQYKNLSQSKSKRLNVRNGLKTHLETICCSLEVNAEEPPQKAAEGISSHKNK